MRTVSCSDFETLQQFVAGNVPVSSADALVEHLENCATCRETVEQFEQRASDPISERLRELQSANDSLIFPFENLNSSHRKTDEIETPIPSNIDGYKILRVLGAGGMGIVYEGEQQPFHRRVAVKVVHGKHRLDPAMLARFQRELEATFRLEHTNIVRAYNAGIVDDQPYLIMEYLEGIDAENFVRQRNPLPLLDVIKLGRQVAAGLQYAHQKGFIHRDVKPSNIFLTKSGTVKLLDFGLAKPNRIDGLDDSSHTQTGLIIGSCDYIAPEQIECAGAVDCRADIYSFGCSLYYFLTGKPPYTGSAINVFTAHLRDSFPFVRELRPDIPETMDELLQRMTDKDVQKRIDSAKEVADALQQIRHDLEPKIIPPPIQEKTVIRIIETNKSKSKKPALSHRFFLLVSVVLFTSVLFYLSYRNQDVVPFDNEAFSMPIGEAEQTPFDDLTEVGLNLLPMDFMDGSDGLLGFYVARLNDQDFPNSLGSSTPSRFEFTLPGKWDFFETQYGTDAGKSACVFTIRADEKELFRSKTINDTKIHSLKLDIRNAKRLILEVERNNDLLPCNGLWLSPKLYRDSATR